MNPQDDSEIPTYKILIVGASDVGKRNIFLRYTKNEFNENFRSSLGTHIKTKQINIDGKNINLEVQNTAVDLKELHPLLRSDFKGCHGILVVFDITNPKSFEAIAEVDQLAENYALEKTIVFIVGNKCDLESERKISKEEGSEFAAAKGYGYFETSAKTAENVNKTFESLARELIGQPEPERRKTFKLKNHKKHDHLKDFKEGACCAST